MFRERVMDFSWNFSESLDKQLNLSITTLVKFSKSVQFPSFQAASTWNDNSCWDEVFLNTEFVSSFK